MSLTSLHYSTDRTTESAIRHSAHPQRAAGMQSVCETDAAATLAN